MLVSGGPQLNNTDLMKSLSAETKQIMGEESVDVLLNKLKQKGKKIKVIEEEDDDEDLVRATRNGDETLAKIEKEKMVLNQDKERIEKELRKKEDILNNEKNEKAQLSNLIRELEEKLVHGGRALEDKDRDQAAKVRDVQLKLKKQKMKEKKLMMERRKKEEEVFLAEKNYKNLQEEVDDMRNVIKQLRFKYKQSLDEIKDLEHENQLNREDLLENIREQEKELTWNSKVISIMLNQTEIETLKDKCKYDENKKEWKIPLFVVTKEKKM
jgi:hypothetical protein